MSRIGNPQVSADCQSATQPISNRRYKKFASLATISTETDAPRRTGTDRKKTLNLEPGTLNVEPGPVRGTGLGWQFAVRGSRFAVQGSKLNDSPQVPVGPGDSGISATKEARVAMSADVLPEGTRGRRRPRSENPRGLATTWPISTRGA